MPGETAIFVEGGNIVQQFSEGTYELTTNNYPFISRLKNALSGGISTFHCVIYFLKNADSMELKWGTDDPIQVRDKVYGIRTSVQARGSYKVRIENPALFLEKLIDMVRFLIPNYIAEGKNQLVIGIGCTGGHHRSVTVAGELYAALDVEDAQYGIKISHRDINR